MRNAKGVKGFLLWSPVANGFFFRIYDPVDKHKFTDYNICCEDIEVEILSGGLVLHEGQEGKEGRLDWKPLQPGDKICRVHYENGQRIERRGHLDNQLKFVVDE